MKMYEKTHEDQHSPIFFLAERGMATTRRRRERPGRAKKGQSRSALYNVKVLPVNFPGGEDGE
jgi:hypothetical protein